MLSSAGLADMSPWWQVSTVSKSMRAAAGSVVASVSRIWLCGALQPRWQHMRLNSALLLSWAPSIGHLHLDNHSLNMPGLPAFAQAAGNKLSYLQVNCSTALAAMQAGHVLSGCSGPVFLYLNASHPPCALPPNMLSLQVVLAKARDGNFLLRHYEPSTAEALLYSAVRHCSSLQHVSLDFKVASVQLSGTFYLPRLDSLRVKISLQPSLCIDLSWLQRQPCSRLDISVAVGTADIAQHQCLVDQLLHLPVTHLTVRWQVALTPELQLMWQRPFPCKRIRLELASPMPDALRALPCSSVLIVESHRHPLTVQWAAVTRHAARICFIMGHKCLSFLDGCSMPDSLEGAWQLSVCLSAVQDWGGARVSGNICYMQNAAASEAGWQWQSEPAKVLEAVDRQD